MPFVMRTGDNPAGVPVAALEGMLAAIRADRPKWMAAQTQLFFATHLGNDMSSAMIDWGVRMCLSPTIWATLQCQRTAFESDNREILRGLTIPALVIHGDADFPAAGHGLFLSHRDRLNADILEFVKG